MPWALKKRDLAAMVHARDDVAMRDRPSSPSAVATASAFFRGRSAQSRSSLMRSGTWRGHADHFLPTARSREARHRSVEPACHSVRLLPPLHLLVVVLQPFTAPLVSPLMMYFCMKTKMRITGTIVTTANAVR